MRLWACKAMGLFFSVIYRPPSANIAKFLGFIDALLEYVSFNRCRLIIVGDFNINISPENKSWNYLLNKIASCSSFNVITTPTRVSPSSTILDFLITNIDACVIAAGTITSDISNHCPILMAFVSAAKGKKTACSPKFFYQAIASHHWIYFDP